MIDKITWTCPDCGTEHKTMIFGKAGNTLRCKNCEGTFTAYYKGPYIARMYRAGWGKEKMKKFELNFLNDGLDLPEFIVICLFTFDLFLIFVVLANVLLPTFGIWKYSLELFEFFKYLSMAQLAPAVLSAAGVKFGQYIGNRYQQTTNPTYPQNQNYSGYGQQGPPI